MKTIYLIHSLGSLDLELEEYHQDNIHIWYHYRSHSYLNPRIQSILQSLVPNLPVLHQGKDVYKRQIQNTPISVT